MISLSLGEDFNGIMNRHWGSILIVIFILISPDSPAQYYRRKPSMARMNVIDGTYGGSGLFLSVNYSRKIYIQRDYFLNVSAGAGTLMASEGISLPHQLTFNYGRSYNFFEVGIGGSCWSGTGNNSGNKDIFFSYSISPIVGYRRDLFNDFVFRVYANPLIHIKGEIFYLDYDIFPYAGISLGYSF